MVAILVLGACTTGPHGDRNSPGADTPVVIDTDAGADDIMAILYLLERPGVRVEAITVVGTGLAHCAGGVRTVLGLLEVTERYDVPVACGSETPLGGSNTFPPEWRAAADDAYGLDLPEPTGRAQEDAEALLRASIRDADPPMTLITLGPLTNVAQALTTEPGLASDVAEIVSMGGALRVAGNVEANPEAEWNFHADPRAADVVLRSGASITLVPLDATNAVPVTPYFLDALAEHHVTPAADTVLALLEGNPEMLEGMNSFWDQLAATLAVDGSSATFETHRVLVLEGAPDVDGELVLASSGTEVRAAMDADPIAFETGFLNTLNGDNAFTITRPEPDLTVAFDMDGCTSDVASTYPAGTIDVAAENALDEGAGVALVRTKAGHVIDELVALLEDPGPGDADPPRWVEVEAWAEAPPQGSSLAPWELEAGAHALVCATEHRPPWVAGTFEVAD